MLLVAASAAANIRGLMKYTSPIRRVQGQIVDAKGAAIRLVDITVFSNPEVWSNDSLNVEQKRAMQRKIAATWTDEDGKFSLKKLAKGSYEVEFSRSGFNTFSVIVQVDPSAQTERFCIKLGVSDTTDEPYFKPCKQ
jgi:hypothetical protein